MQDPPPPKQAAFPFVSATTVVAPRWRIFRVCAVLAGACLLILSHVNVPSTWPLSSLMTQRPAAVDENSTIDHSLKSSVPEWYSSEQGDLKSDSEEQLSLEERQELAAQIELEIQRAELDIQSLGAIKCRTCSLAVGALNKIAVSRAISGKFAVKVGTQICIRLRLQPEEVCRNIVPLFGPWLLTVLSSQKFSVLNFCGALDYCKNVEPIFQPSFPTPHPPVRRQRPPIRADGRRRYMLHFSDWHYDEAYMEGLEAECSDPICCRAPEHPLGAKISQKVPITRPAGPFGDYRCDTPHRLAREVLKQAQLVAKDADFVIVTGDLPPHDVWLSSEASVTRAEQQVADDLQESFTPLNKTVFMTIGNHDSYVPNSFPPTNFPGSDARVLYQSLAKQWSQWLPEASRVSLSLFGYYSVVRAEDNLRIISLNTNFAYLLNWWIFVADADPENMLHWLVDQLQQAESAAQDVYIIGHISPGNGVDVSRLWSAAYNKIVARYEDTIVAQFFGHSHMDQVKIFYDDDARTNPVNVAYLGPSITTYPFLNPGFRVYEVDSSTNRVVNHYTHVLDLPASNAAGEPKWMVEYDAKSLYNMSDLSPRAWHNLTERMENELKQSRSGGPTPLLDSYVRMKYKSSDVPSRAKCDRDCKKRVVCNIRSAKSFFPCPDIDALAAVSGLNQTTVTATVDAFQDPLAC